MPVQHHLLTLSGHVQCGVTIFTGGKNSPCTIVISEIDRDEAKLPGLIEIAADKIRRTYVQQLNPSSLSWIYRRLIPGGQDLLFDMDPIPCVSALQRWAVLGKEKFLQKLTGEIGLSREPSFPDFLEKSLSLQRSTA